MENQKGIITQAEMELCRHCIDFARSNGASDMRVSMSKSIQNSISVLDGEIDKICYSEDCSIFLHVYAMGRYGTFSTNRLEKNELEAFVLQAIRTTCVMAPDECRMLPKAENKARNCSRGDELELVDESYFDISQQQKMDLALKASVITGSQHTIDSLECEYSDSLDDNYMIDSQGFEGRHTESNFGFCSEVTAEDANGDKYSGYQWISTPFWKDFRPQEVSAQALQDAVSQFDPQDVESGKYTVVVAAKAASRLVGPVLRALDGNSIQQKMSFLSDSLGKEVLGENLNIYDNATQKGRMGSRLFDTEGSAVSDGPIIENGKVQMYFVNSYCSAKTGLEPTVEGPSRPTVLPFICNSDKKEITLNDILAHCGSGILVTGFNGGNCNQASGNFSFGIEGFYFENGSIVHPVSEALMTGKMTELWKTLIAAGSDARDCARWQIPSLAFKDVDISA